MNIFVATSDSCISALKPFSFLFNKFWHFKEKVTVLNRGVITDVDLPDNFSIVSLGENKGMDYWCDDLRNYFLSIDDDHFIFMQEDHFPLKEFNKKTYDVLLSCINDDMVGRIAITNDRAYDPYSHYKTIDGVNIIQSTQDSMYRISCQPSIWKREYMLKHMLSGLKGPWEFELLKNQYHDGYTILGLTENYPILVSNAISKGKYDEEWFRSHHVNDHYEMDMDIVNYMIEKEII